MDEIMQYRILVNKLRCQLARTQESLKWALDEIEEHNRESKYTTPQSDIDRLRAVEQEEV